MLFDYAKRDDGYTIYFSVTSATREEIAFTHDEAYARTISALLNNACGDIWDVAVKLLT